MAKHSSWAIFLIVLIVAILAFVLERKAEQNVAPGVSMMGPISVAEPVRIRTSFSTRYCNDSSDCVQPKCGQSFASRCPRYGCVQGVCRIMGSR
ncbi:hypothetical protein HY486_02935 [Candidatus Woesearchaeota archaeon]|nr:hypothetical protein [Candidatus Woesearchaeota archaeon]